MKHLLAVFSTLLLACASAEAAQCQPESILVRGVDVWSPETIARNLDVLVADGHIHSVAPSGRLQPPKGARILNARGQIMLPGFIDSHVHFVLPGRVQTDWGGHPHGPASVTGPQLVASGVTSARLHLDTIKNAAALHRDSQDSCVPLPRLQVGGPAFIPGTPHHDRGAVWSPADMADADAKVRRLHDADFEWIAVHDAHRFAPDELAAVTRTARELGLRILASGYTQEELGPSLDFRPDTIDYIDVSPQPEYPGAVLERARNQPALVWVAGLGFHERYRAHQQTPALIDDAFNYELIEPALAALLRTSVHAESANRDSEQAKRLAAAYPTLRRKFAQLRASGITLAAGTDAGSAGHFHRDSIWQEINAWVSNGATVTEALTAVTVNGAKVLGDFSVGHLRPGARADFILFRGNLADTPLRPQLVSTVSKGGVLFVEDGRWRGRPPN